MPGYPRRAECPTGGEAFDANMLFSLGGMNKSRILNQLRPHSYPDGL